MKAMEVGSILAAGNRWGAAQRPLHDVSKIALWDRAEHGQTDPMIARVTARA